MTFIIQPEATNFKKAGKRQASVPTKPELTQIQRACAAQAEYVKANKLPHFAPPTGTCYRCSRNIYETRGSTDYNGRPIMRGISVETAGSELVTGCPHCNRSYCD